VNEVAKRGLLSRMAMPLMLLIFIAPMVAAWVVYNYFPNVVRSLGASNYGEFVIPPVEVSLDGYANIDNQPLAQDYFQKNWSYVYIREQCDADCIEHLMLIKNVRLTQGKEISRLRRLLVLAEDSVDEKLRQRLAEFPGMQTVILANETQRRAFLKPFTFAGNENPIAAGHIYVVDPDAKLMMYYKNEKEILKLGKGMQKDMSKLMHNSQLRK
jgi:hypothetical protein